MGIVNIKNDRDVIDTVILLGGVLFSIFTIMFLVYTEYEIKKTDVYIKDYNVLSDNENIKIDVASVDDSNIGKYDEYTIDNSHYVDFYTSNSLLNEIMYKDTYIKVDENDTEIWFNRGDNEYELVLIKSGKSGKWEYASKDNKKIRKKVKF